MRNSLHILIAVSLGLFLVSAPGFAWEPDAKDKAQVKAAAELELYKSNEKVKPFLDQAYGYAILPNFFRIAAGFGFNYGNGFVVAEDQLVGKVSTFQGTLGFTYGLEFHSQIILFQNREVFEIFEQGRWEFQGRGGLSFIVFGGAVDPAFLPEVAIFSRTKAGLMVEAAAIVSKYNYKPIKK